MGAVLLAVTGRGGLTQLYRTHTHITPHYTIPHPGLPFTSQHSPRTVAMEIELGVTPLSTHILTAAPL